MSFIKTITVSFLTSTLVIFIGMLINFITVVLTNSDLAIRLELILGILYTTVVWPTLQTKLFLFYSKRFNLVFWTTVLFYIMSSLGLVISFFIGVMTTGVIFGTTKGNSSGFVDLIPPTIHSFVLIFITFIVYATLVYLSIHNRPENS